MIPYVSASDDDDDDVDNKPDVMISPSEEEEEEDVTRFFVEPTLFLLFDKADMDDTTGSAVALKSRVDDGSEDTA